MSHLSLKVRIPLAIITIMLVVCVFIGSSFALWKLEKIQETENVIDTGCFDVVFEEATDNNSINLTNTYPMSDDKGLRTIPYVFTIKNKCSIKANYTIYLNTKNNTNGKTQLADQWIKYAINEKNDVGIIANKLTSASINDDKLAFENSSSILKSYILASGEIEAASVTDGDTNYPEKQYSLRLWIDSSATTAINGQRFEASLEMLATPVK